MKMSDVFVLPVKSNRVNVVVCGKTVIDPDKPGNMDVADEYAAHAINNHDRLSEENKKLREFVLLLANAEVKREEVDIDYVGVCDIKFIDDSWKYKAKKLLSKLEGE